MTPKNQKNLEKECSEVPKRNRKKYFCTLEYPLNMEWHNYSRFYFGFGHLLAIQGILMLVFGIIPASYIIPGLFMAYISGIGISVGCHRLWAHRTFKAKLGLKIFLAYAYTMSAQQPIFKWCRDHRLHHKYSDTNADPHNATRGFWFSHIGWTFLKEDPIIKEKEEGLDFSDLDNDPVVRFQRKYYWLLHILCVYIVPMSIVSSIFPDLSLYKVLCGNSIWIMAAMHATFLINSGAHWHQNGNKPYDKTMRPSDNAWVSLLAMGEGWHNYHHTFPWDYRCADFGLYKMNMTTLIIEIFAWLGLAYDLKSVPEYAVLARVKRTGNVGLYEKFKGVSVVGSGMGNVEKAVQKGDTLPPWGWGDEDIVTEHYDVTQTLKRKICS